jgi:hypothetical protein
VNRPTNESHMIISTDVWEKASHIFSLSPVRPRYLSCWVPSRTLVRKLLFPRLHLSLELPLSNEWSICDYKGPTPLPQYSTLSGDSAPEPSMCLAEVTPE